MKLELFIVLLLAAGCSGQAISQETPPPPTVITGDDLTGGTARRLTLKLTLSTPSDLQVQEGDRVQQGDVLADRLSDRQRLEAQLARLQLQISRAQQPASGPPPVRRVPEVAGLPPASFLSELATMEQMRLRVEAAERALQQQQRMVDLVETLPNHQVPEAVLPHEQEVLAARQRDLDQARAAHQLAQAQLAQAQNERQYQEYQHSITVSNRLLQVQQNELQRSEQMQRQQQAERDRQFQLSQLEQQRNQLQLQLLSLATVRSPFDGRIQRLRWQGQNDQDLIVELTLVTQSDNEPRPGDRPSAAP